MVIVNMCDLMKIHSDQIEIGSVLPFAKLVSRNVMSFDTEKKNTQKKN
jgi:hypothetical protein